MAHINSNYIHLTKNKPIDWRFKPPRFAIVWPIWKSHHNIVNTFLKGKNHNPPFCVCGSAAFPAGLPRTSRAVPEIKKPFATSFPKPSNYQNALRFPSRRMTGNMWMLWTIHSRESVFFFNVPLEQTATSIVHGLMKVNVIGLPQQYLIEPGHCMKAYFTCKSRRCRGELRKMVFPLESNWQS